MPSSRGSLVESTLLAPGIGLLVLGITPVERVIHNRRRGDPKDVTITTTAVNGAAGGNG